MPTASTYFPDLGILPSYRRQRVHSTQIEESFGKAQKMAMLPVGGRRKFTFTTTPMPISTRSAIHEFLYDQQGAYGTFYFYTPDTRKYTDYAAATTVAADLTYQIPFKKADWLTDAETITAATLDAVTITNPADYTLSADTNGEIIINLTADPGNGKALVVTVVAKERVIVRQDSDTEDEVFIDSADIHGMENITLIEEL